MHAPQLFATVAAPTFSRVPKTIAPWLIALVDIDKEYFGTNPTTLTFADIQKEVIRTHVDLPLRDLVEVLKIVEAKHTKLMDSRKV